MIRQIQEGKIAWLEGITQADIPDRLPTGIQLHIKDGIIGLEAQGIVGAIPLLNGQTLHILSKVGRVNFLRLLFKAEGDQKELEREYDSFVDFSLEEEANIDSIVARQLMLSISEILKRSPMQERIKRRHVGRYVTGQLNAVNTALNLAQRKVDPVDCVVNEKTLDIAENRVLTEAVTRSWPLLATEDRVLFGLIRDRWIRRFPPSNSLTDDIALVEKRFASRKYGGARDYYRRALMLGRIVLGHQGVSADGSPAVQGDAFVLNTAAIFEKYLRNVISAALTEDGYVVTKGGTSTTSLYTDGSFELCPDIVISRNGRVVLLADAKYKEPTAGDHYQMHTYLRATGAKRGLLLAPLYSGDDIKVREFATVDRTVVREVYLPMQNLELTEAYLGSLVHRFS